MTAQLLQTLKETQRKQYLVDQFNDNQLQYITKSVDLINACTQIFQGTVLT